MKLRHSVLLGLVGGLAALIALPSTGATVGVAVPLPVVESIEEVFDNDGFAGRTIAGNANGYSVQYNADAATEDASGTAHWTNNGEGHEACETRTYGLDGPKQKCTNMTNGGQHYHIKSYVNRKFKVVRIPN